MLSVGGGLHPKFRGQAWCSPCAMLRILCNYLRGVDSRRFFFCNDRVYFVGPSRPETVDGPENPYLVPSHSVAPFFFCSLVWGFALLCLHLAAASPLHTLLHTFLKRCSCEMELLVGIALSQWFINQFVGKWSMQMMTKDSQSSCLMNFFFSLCKFCHLLSEALGHY